MVEIILGAIAIMLYLAIGVFLDNMFSTATTPPFLVALIWPLILLVAFILYFCVILPTQLAEWFKRKGE